MAASKIWRGMAGFLNLAHHSVHQSSRAGQNLVMAHPKTFLLSGKAGVIGGNNRLLLFNPDWYPASQNHKQAGRIWSSLEPTPEDLDDIDDHEETVEDHEEAIFQSLKSQIENNPAYRNGGWFRVVVNENYDDDELWFRIDPRLGSLTVRGRFQK